MPRMEQRPQPSGDLLLVAPPHSQQAQGYGDNAHRDTDWPELVSLAEQARRFVRAIVVRVVADRAERAIRPLCRESGRRVEAGRPKVKPARLDGLERT